MPKPAKASLSDEWVWMFFVNCHCFDLKRSGYCRRRLWMLPGTRCQSVFCLLHMLSTLSLEQGRDVCRGDGLHSAESVQHFELPPGHGTWPPDWWFFWITITTLPWCTMMGYDGWYHLVAGSKVPCRCLDLGVPDWRHGKNLSCIWTWQDGSVLHGGKWTC